MWKFCQIILFITRDKCGRHHVRMPCSSENLNPVLLPVCSLKVEMQCQNDSVRHLIVWNRYGTMLKFQWKNRLTFRDIYVQSWQNHSFPIIFRKHTQGLAPSCDVTHGTGDNFSGSSILSFSPSLHKNVCLWEQSDFEMEFDILLHEYQPFDCVLQFGSVRCDVTSENSRKKNKVNHFV